MADDLSLDDEYAVLAARTAELQAEHNVLEGNPDDLAGHRAHRVKLQAHIEALHDFVGRLRAARQQSSED